MSPQRSLLVCGCNIIIITACKTFSKHSPCTQCCCLLLLPRIQILCLARSKPRQLINWYGIDEAKPSSQKKHKTMQLRQLA